MDSVSWTSMNEGTKEDYEFLGARMDEHISAVLVPNLISLLETMKGPTLGYQIDRYQHSLQSATRALRAGERLDIVVAALFHDIGDTVAPHNHSAVAAAVLRPFVDDEAHWVVKHHGLFQGYYYFHHIGGDRNARDAFADHEFYEACVGFCENYDQNCFDPDYDTLGLEDFTPMIEELFGRPPIYPEVAAIDAAADDADV